MYNLGLSKARILESSVNVENQAPCLS